MTQKNKMPDEIWYQDADGYDFVYRKSPAENYIDNVLPDNIKHYVREDLVIPKSKIEALIKKLRGEMKNAQFALKPDSGLYGNVEKYYQELGKSIAFELSLNLAQALLTEDK